MALAEIGRYTGVDRLATWENHLVALRTVVPMNGVMRVLSLQ